MPFPPHLPVPVQTFVSGVQAALSGFFHKLQEKAGDLRVRALLIMDRLLAKVPPEKRRIVVISAVSGLFVVLVVLPLVFAAGGTAAKDKPQEQDSATAGSLSAALPGREFIPHDDVFLPDEPDFIPGVMLEREQRTEWTAADAAPWWQDPLKNGEEPWRSMIEKTVDEILESVP